MPSGVATARYEEAAYHRSEMEFAKRENDNLRLRIKELERNLTNRRESDTGRGPSDSTSTTATTLPPVRGGLQRRTSTMEYDDDAVDVGESAGSVGLGGGR